MAQSRGLTDTVFTLPAPPPPPPSLRGLRSQAAFPQQQEQRPPGDDVFISQSAGIT